MISAYAVRNGLVAVAYTALGWAGLLLAVRPGDSPGIWLPAGLSLAVLLRWGPGMWPGIWLGAFLLKAFHTAGTGWGVPGAAQFAIAAAVAVGSMLQALAVERLLAWREPVVQGFDRLDYVLRFALLWSPAGCLIGASVAVSTGWAVGRSEMDAAPLNWLSWWFGDWMGMVIVAPAVLALLGPGPGDGGLRERGRRVAVAATSLLCLVAVVALYAVSVRQERARLASNFDAFAGEIAAAVQRELEVGRRTPAYLRDLFVASATVSEEEFAAFSRVMLERGEGLTAAAWLAREPAEGTVEPQAPGDLPDPAGRFELRGPGDSAWLYRLRHIEPFIPPSTLEPRAGLDLFSAMERARASGEVTASQALRAIVDGEVRTVVLFIAAVGGRVPVDPAEHADVVLVGIEPAPLIERAVQGYDAGQVSLRVRDITTTEPALLYERPLAGASLPGPPIAFARRFEMAGRNWEFGALAGQDFVAATEANTPRQVQVLGLLVTAMLVCFVLVLSGRDVQVRRLAAERTAALDERNARLQAEMSERAAVEDRLRETQRNFLDSLAFAQVGAWDFDVETGVVTGTRELARLYGLPDETFRMDIQTILNLMHSGDRERFEESMNRGLGSDVDTALDYRILRRDGQQRWVTSRSRRRVDPDGRVRVLGVSWDITERVAANARANLLATAFEQGGEAIFIADADLGILEVNAAFCALTGIEREEAVGRDVYDLFAGRATREQFRAMVATARERGNWQGEVWGRTRDGGDLPQWLVLAAVRNDRGLLVNHIGSFVDISERKHAEAKIEYLAHHDALTGLPNRFALQGRLEQALAQAARSQSRLAVMFIDMDRFKDINDSLGHDVGDLLLLDIARRLRDCVRTSDIVARLGGDEFVVVLTSVADAEAAAKTWDPLESTCRHASLSIL